jgi:hypothetical protein
MLKQVVHIATIEIKWLSNLTSWRYYDEWMYHLNLRKKFFYFIYSPALDEEKRILFAVLHHSNGLSSSHFFIEALHLHLFGHLQSMSLSFILLLILHFMDYAISLLPFRVSTISFVHQVISLLVYRRLLIDLFWSVYEVSRIASRCSCCCCVPVFQAYSNRLNDTRIQCRLRLNKQQTLKKTPFAK